MALHLLFAAMLVAAALAVLLPLARRPRLAGVAADTAPADLHRLRLAEIARDLDRGLLDRAGAEAARNEAARLLLRTAARANAADRMSPATAASGAGSPWPRRIAALAVAIGLPAFALPIYAFMGSPDLPSRPFVAHVSGDSARIGMDALIAQVEARLVEHPDDGKGYEVIAPIYMRLGRYEDAVRARAEALRLLGETPDRLADLAEARVAAAGGVVTREAADDVERALALDPKHPKARFLKALALEQDGRRDDAIAALKTMLVDAPPDAPWRQVVADRIARLQSPGGDPAIAKLPPAAQNEAIRAMVAGLAERLRKQGGSAEEWARLVRSYVVLGDLDKARATLAEARAALGDEPSRRTLLEVARATGLEASP